VRGVEGEQGGGDGGGGGMSAGLKRKGKKQRIHFDDHIEGQVICGRRRMTPRRNNSEESLTRDKPCPPAQVFTIIIS
jgi:hypothetical protein